MPRPKTLESVIVDAITKAIKAGGGKVYKMWGGPMTIAGAPDLIGSFRGRPFMVEVKRPGLAATPLQANELRQWTEQKCWVVGVAHSLEEFTALFGVDN